MIYYASKYLLFAANCFKKWIVMGWNLVLKMDLLYNMEIFYTPGIIWIQRCMYPDSPVIQYINCNFANVSKTGVCIRGSSRKLTLDWFFWNY